MNNIEQLRQQAEQVLLDVADLKALEDFRVKYLGKKGLVTELLKQLGTLPADQRKAAGQQINQLKQHLQKVIADRRNDLAEAALQAQFEAERVDVTQPGRYVKPGGLHPVTRTMNRISEIFAQLGFQVVTGPEIEDDLHNFEALNFPAHHPARTMHDTFYLPDGHLLRTHTSPVQIRAMKNKKPPIRIIAPGRVYRSDSDQTHTPMFNQVEGLVVGENVTFASLKGVLEQFVSTFFEQDLKIRLRPSYFPFTEPSAEVDVEWRQADGGRRWLEVLGCGMVHPNVLQAGGIDPCKYTGFAFGLGVERFAMLRYGVQDLRKFFENDSEFLRQFS